LLKNIADFYDLKKAQIYRLERFGEKSADNLLKSIEESKNVPFARVLFALGIPDVGAETAKILSKEFNNIQVLIDSSDLALLKKIKDSFIPLFPSETKVSKENTYNLKQELIDAESLAQTIPLFYKLFELKTLQKKFLDNYSTQRNELLFDTRDVEVLVREIIEKEIPKAVLFYHRIPTVDIKIISNIIDFFENKENLEIIDRLKNKGIQFENIEQENSEPLYLKDKKIVVTGSFEYYARKEYEDEIIERFGGKKVAAISSKTSFLLAGKGGGSKRSKAEKLGVEIINEEDFLKMINLWEE